MLIDKQLEPSIPISREKEERMWRLAYQLADSGDYSGWDAIEIELRIHGFSRAKYLLEDDQVRDWLDRRCNEARKAAKKRWNAEPS
jgi:hypothetical protein